MSLPPTQCVAPFLLPTYRESIGTGPALTLSPSGGLSAGNASTSVCVGDSVYFPHLIFEVPFAGMISYNIFYNAMPASLSEVPLDLDLWLVLWFVPVAP